MQPASTLLVLVGQRLNAAQQQLLISCLVCDAHGL